jgi:hypothetical protein
MLRLAPAKFDLALLRGAGSLPVLAPRQPEVAPRAKVASYPTLEQAHQALDVLSEEGLSTRHVCVVGEPDSTTKTYTYGRAAAQGAAAGAWVGLALGFLSGLVELSSWHERAFESASGGSTPYLTLALISAVVGALLGMLVGAVTHALADVASASSSDAARTSVPPHYDVLVDAEHAEGARNLLWLVGP